MTRQRQVILDELKKLDSHPTADELYELVRRRLPRISLGTIYRNLDLMAASGAIKKLDIGLSQNRFDGGLEEHYHARCIKCGSVDDVALNLVRTIEDAFREVCDYQIIGHQLVIIGLCPKCKNDKSE